MCSKVKLVGHSSTAKNRYCSTSCQGQHRKDIKFIEFCNGELTKSQTIKYNLELVYGHKCFVCGISEWNGKEIVLELEHKDGNSDNNHPKNLELICPNCHSQTSTYKAKNKGNGRHYRRQRYKEGKSY